MKTTFEELKNELCQKAKEHKACSDQYKRALNSKTEDELLKVIYDNISWCIEKKDSFK